MWVLLHISVQHKCGIIHHRMFIYLFCIAHTCHTDHQTPNVKEIMERTAF